MISVKLSISVFLTDHRSRSSFSYRSDTMLTYLKDSSVKQQAAALVRTEEKHGRDQNKYKEGGARWKVERMIRSTVS